MAGPNELIVGTLQQFDCSPWGETFVNGQGHPAIRFSTPDGRMRKWSWPRIGHSDPRAMKNNLSQLKRYLRGITQ